MKYDRVSPVGPRYQVTLPKKVREKTKFSNGRTKAYIQAPTDKDYIIISYDQPDRSHSIIKLSEKAQFVIPKDFRESKSIEKGSNLIFSRLDETIIKMVKLDDLTNRKTTEIRWEIFIEVLKIINHFVNHDIKVEDNSITITSPDGLDNKQTSLLIIETERIAGKRLIVEKIRRENASGIKLTIY
ncbi:MAG: hypothetical protein ACXAEU_13785 [Candidatus Hodarchaeales archaeon]|jgi:bifunctional DNA-binding transcriptional regulator/antitoxin component of YhaV-PrlF toxin-antitoxin module